MVSTTIVLFPALAKSLALPHVLSLNRPGDKDLSLSESFVCHAPFTATFYYANFSRQLDDLKLIRLTRLNES